MSRWKWPVVVLAVVLVLGTGGYAVARTRESDASYRTATATVGDVERTLDLSGTVTAAGRRDLSFGAAGSVSKVAVKAGQKVRSGQVLARLDPTSFDAAVTSAVATLAKAKAQLATDEDAQSTAVTTSASSTSSSTTQTSTTQTPTTQTPTTQASSSTKSTSSSSGSKSPTTTNGAALKKLLAQLATQQQAVTAAQTDASNAITASKAALAAQIQACKDDSTSTPTATPSAAPSAGADTGDTGSGDGSVSAACTNALAAVQAAQDTVAQKQDTLQAALTALGQTLGQAVKASSTPSSGSGSTQSGAQSSGGSSGSQSSSGSQGSGQSTPSSTAKGSTSGASGSGSGSGSGGSVTAAKLAQDQADIDTAQARLLQARAERSAATLRAPYAGRILQAEVAKGDLVAASDPAFVLVGSGATTVTTTVTSAQVPSLRRGQRVSVVPAGWTTTLTGTVSAIGLLPDSNSAFPVIVTVSSGKTVAEGSTASVAIVTGSASKAVTVPVSALSKVGQRTTVQVMSGSTVTRTSVTTGVVGTRRASITQGLKAGAKVVLADLDATVPSSTTTNNQGGARFRTGGAGLGTQTFARQGG